MSSLMDLPNELLLNIASRLETEHLHSLVLTNRHLQWLLQDTIYESPTKDALTRVIDEGNVAVFRKFLDCGLDVNVSLTQHRSTLPLLAYCASDLNAMGVAMTKLLFETGKVDTSGWRVFGMRAAWWNGHMNDMAELFERYGMPLETITAMRQRGARHIMLGWGLLLLP
jgi:hypothetical protein